MKKIFKNHISVVVESMFGFLPVILFLCVCFFDETDTNEFWIPVCVLLLLVLLVTVFQVYQWYFTTITIEEGEITIFRNTINKKKQVFHLQNISNINLEQNIFERVIRTCRLKFDTNSLSTSEETDVKIVLKKQQAQQLKEWLVMTPELREPEETEKSRISYSMKKILVHSLLSTRIDIFSVIALLLVFVGPSVVFNVFKFLSSYFLMAALMILFAAICFIAFAVLNLIKSIFFYCDFSVERKQQRIHLNYGLLNRREYTIPVDKISGIVISQTVLARVFKRYRVDLINIGMDDEEAEAQSVFLMYETKENIKETIRVLLPEFYDKIAFEGKRQMATVWLLWSIRLFWCAIVLGIVTLLVNAFNPKFTVVAGMLSVLLCLFYVGNRIGAYVTESFVLNETSCIVIEGSFNKKIVLTSYDKVQYVTCEQNIIARRMQIATGSVYLQASIQNRLLELPYLEKSVFTKLQEKFILPKRT